MQLYKLADEYQQAFNDLHSMDDLTPEIIEDSLAGMVGEIEDKGKAVAAFTLNIDADIAKLKEHEAAVAAKRRTLEKRRDWMRDYLKENMERCGINKIESPFFNVTLIKPRKQVVIEDDAKLPRDYMRVVESPDKTLIKKALDDGYEVPGAKLADGKAGLRIS